MSISRLREFTTARVGLERAGNSLATRDHLALLLAHARARQAVHAELDPTALLAELGMLGRKPLLLRSAARDRAEYLRRPDLGRKLSDESCLQLDRVEGSHDAVFVIADGLSAYAVELHAARMLASVFPLLDAQEWRIAPVVVVSQGRVAIGDEVGQRLRAALSIVLIGERPGLSAADSLGIYLSWNPHPGLTDADRNCLSNIRADGLGYAEAAHKLAFLMVEAKRRKLSGVKLKEDAHVLLPKA